MDIVRRILSRFYDLDVVLLMGITDVDDKIINRARDLGVSFEAHARKYEREFCEDLENLGVLPPTLFMRVSEHIEAVVEFCSALRDKGFAYTAPDGSLYFELAKCPQYAVFRTPGSVSDDPEAVKTAGKKDARDFALWKGAKPGEPSWDAPWGPGRPGWHVECSAMASTIFGSSIDLHTGGRDLAFPHHENELAQSRCYHGVSKWVNHWLHTGQVHVCGPDGKPTKMAKSLGNAMPLREFLGTHSADVFRMFCLQKAYKADVLLAPDFLRGAEGSLQALNDFCANAKSYVRGQVPTAQIIERELYDLLNRTRSCIQDAFADDLDYPTAVSSVQHLASEINARLQAPSKDVQHSRSDSSKAAVAACLEFVTNFFRNLGLELASAQTRGVAGSSTLARVLDDTVAFRATVRAHALESKDKVLLQACDVLRSQLEGEGVKIKDRKTNSTWEFLAGTPTDIKSR
ncbi:hypothetical protein V5799_019708 [Amblyomma americanum]|uniref:tRNA synthetases class I catalytic domain-containing protein n=1 Tax=Amblyomma americanum TaxID=6943 RepID=A0AAQ4EWK7_AMBAM